MKDEMIEEAPPADAAETGDDREARRYEIGYLLALTIAAENISSTFETLIRGTILNAGGQVIAGEAPKLIPLAYPIRQTVENKSLRFREAYFASLRFTIAPERIVELDKTLRLSPPLLRFLIVGLPPPVESSRRRLPGDTPLSGSPVRFAKDGGSEGAEMSQADMDREIEGLLAPAL